MRGKLPKDVSCTTLESHISSVSSLAFSPDGKTLASGTNDNTIYRWSVSAGKRRKKLTGHTGSVTSLAFSPDGKTLASASEAIKLSGYGMQSLGNEALRSQDIHRMFRA